MKGGKACSEDLDQKVHGVLEESHGLSGCTCVCVREREKESESENERMCMCVHACLPTAVFCLGR